MSVHDFVSDARKGVISFKSINDKNDLELMAYDHYLKKISHEDDKNFVFCDPEKHDYKYCMLKKKEIEKAELQEEKLIAQEEAQEKQAVDIGEDDIMGGRRR